MLIDAPDITVVMQGNIRPSIGRAIHSVRQVLPGARLILSTFDLEAPQRYAGFVDEVVLSKDPGGMPPSVKANQAEPNNTNRQLVSSQAGLARVTTPYALKMRTDCALHDIGFIRLLQQYSQADSECRRLVASSFYTRHPHGLACYLFHISDWFIFGTSERVRQFFSSPLVSLDEATWFERRAHLASGTYAARRFRARFTPEQYITTHFARALGYRTPEFLNDLSPGLSEEYESFLAKEVIVAYPSQLGFTLEKYPDIEHSLYQRVDCVGHADWLDLARTKSDIAVREPANESAYLNLRMKITRFIANRFRRAIIKAALNPRRLMSMRQPNEAHRPSLACVITGLPRGNDLSLESLKFTTTRYETTFFAVFREEFDSPSVREALIRNLPGIHFVIVPEAVTTEAVAHFEGKIATTVAKMWHEVFYAAESVELAAFDMVMRTRFDLFFSPMHLPPPATDESSIFIPERMSWSGSNDMIALGTPAAFKKYARIFHTLDWLIEKGIKAPEALVKCALGHLELEEKPLNLYFGLYREALMSTLNRSQLGVLAWKDPLYTTYRIGEKADTTEGRAVWIKNAKALTHEEALFPTYQVTNDDNFYPVDLDSRDGTPFRTMGLHAHINRAVSIVQTIEFTICHHPPDWDMGRLTVHIDGRLFNLRKKGLDAFGRIRVVGNLGQPYHGRTPWSKVGFECIGAYVPAEVSPNSTDRRSVTISITDPLLA